MSQVYRWMKQDEDFKADVEMAKQTIAVRRERRMVIDQDVNSNVLSYTQPYYCKVYKDQLIERAQLKQKLDSPPTKIEIVMPDLTRIEDKEKK